MQRSKGKFAVIKLGCAETFRSYHRLRIGKILRTFSASLTSHCNSLGLRLRPYYHFINTVGLLLFTNTSNAVNRLLMSLMNNGDSTLLRNLMLLALATSMAAITALSHAGATQWIPIKVENGAFILKRASAVLTATHHRYRRAINGIRQRFIRANQLISARASVDILGAFGRGNFALSQSER